MDMYLLFSLSTISSISWLCTFCFYFIIIIFAMRYVDLGFPSSSDSKESACNAGDLGSIPGDPLEKGMATHFSILAWRIPWMEEPGGLPVHGVPKSLRALSRHAYTHMWNLSSPTRGGSLTPVV